MTRMPPMKDIRKNSSYNSSDEERVIKRFTEYLNGPMGKIVLENLSEGEHFLLQTSEHTLRVTKRKGCAEVTIANLPRL